MNLHDLCPLILSTVALYPSTTSVPCSDASSQAGSVTNTVGRKAFGLALCGVYMEDRSCRRVRTPTCSSALESFAGVEIGFINTIIPPWISEIAKAHNRGANFAIIFTSNYEYLSLQGLLAAHTFRYRYHYRVLDQLQSSKLPE